MTFSEFVRRFFTDYLLSPYVLTATIGMIVFLVVRRYLHTRTHNRKRDAQIAALTPLAQRLGGTVVGPEGAGMWTAELKPPLEFNVGGIMRVAQRSKRKFDLSMDFQRGPWHVRVTEASVRVDTRGFGVQIEQAHRIEVSTARMTPMKTVRLDKYGYNGKPLSPKQIDDVRHGWVKGRPRSAERNQLEWQHVPLLEPMDQEFSAYSTDPAAAVRELNFDALHWFIDREDELPVGAAQSMRLTFEEGYVYLEMSDHIFPDQLMGVVDTICGLLDRMPGARPRHPAAAV